MYAIDQANFFPKSLVAIIYKHPNYADLRITFLF